MLTTTTPKLRADLRTSSIEDAEGVLYYDVSDPKTGSVLRLFDFEWLVAQRLDGEQSFEELARWTEQQFGFETSREDLEVYADRLQQLGLIDTAAVSAPRPPVVTPVAATPVVTPPSTPVTPPRPSRDITPPPATRPVTPAPIQPQIQAQAPLTVPAATEPLTAKPELRRPRMSDDALMGAPVLLAKPTPAEKPVVEKPIVEKPAEKPIEQKPIETKPAEPERLPERPSGPITPIAPELSPVRARANLLEALEGLPPPVGTDATPSSSAETPKPEALTGALSASPTALLEQAASPTIDTSPSAKTPTGLPVQSVLEPVKPETPADKPVETKPAEPARPDAPTQALEPVPLKPAVKTPEPEKPTVMSPVVPPEPVKPATAPVPPVPTEQPSGGAGKWIGLVLFLIVAAAALYYFLVLKPGATPPALGVMTSPAMPQDVPRTFPSPAVVRQPEPQVLKVEGDGKVATVVAENAEVTQEQALVVLDSHAKLNKEMVDLRDRLALYQKKLDAAKAKGKNDKDAQAKIDEKQARLAQVEAAAKKAQVVAPRPGLVTKVMVQVGQAVTAGTDAVAVSDKGLGAELKVPVLEAQGMKQGQEVKLSGAGGPVAAHIAALKTEAEFTTIQFGLADGASVKPGDELRLAKEPLTQVVRLPASAVVEGNKVFILREGKAQAKQVTVADREGEDVLVQGLQSGEQIITSRLSEIRDGVAVQPQAAGAGAAKP